MGAIVMFIMLIVLSISSFIYFFIQDRREAKHKKGTPTQV